MLNQMHRLINV